MIDKNMIAPVHDQIRMFILDVLRHDVIEQVPSILKLLNNDGGIGWREFWPHDFTVDEVVPALEGLVRAGYVRALREQGSGDQLVPVCSLELDIGRDQDTLWFELTDEGRRVWGQWEPPQ